MYYYTENDKKYFYFYDEEFSKINWFIEPKDSLQTLYRKRAEQIRQDYEYVILAYSGGHDSTQVLETFYYNNIHINEILMVGAFSQDSYTGSDENHNAEIVLNAYPTLKKMNLSNTKITIEDYTKLFNNIENFSLIQKYGSNWIDNINCWYSVHHFYWHDVFKFIGKDNNKNTAVVFGCDKPIFNYDTNNKTCYTFFSDAGLFDNGNYQKYKNSERVNFYTALESVDIIKKQLHIIMNFFIKNCIVNKELSIQTFFNNYNTITNKLIYDLKNPLIFESKKSKINILSVRDIYLLKNKNTEIFKIYNDGIQKLSKKLIQDNNQNHRISKKYLLSKPLELI